MTNFGTVSVVAGSGAPAISTNSGTIINNAGGSIIGDFNAIVAVGNTRSSMPVRSRRTTAPPLSSLQAAIP
jgi:hypothetical protein